MIIGPNTALEFSYDEGCNHAYFTVELLNLKSRKRVGVNVPLRISAAELEKKLTALVAERRGAAVLSTAIVEDHVRLYQANLYYLRTLMHDAGLHETVLSLLEWYARSFTVALAWLLASSPEVADEIERSAPLKEGSDVLASAMNLARALKPALASSSPDLPGSSAGNGAGAGAGAA